MALTYGVVECHWMEIYMALSDMDGEENLDETGDIDMEDTGLMDVFGYGGMRYRFSALRESLCGGKCLIICGIGLKVGVIVLR